jgi:hypothetical protein
VYGRWEYLSERRSPKTGKASARARDVAQWPVKIIEHHPSYIRWEEFVKNQEQLRRNWGHEDNRGVPREGRALLQGIVYWALSENLGCPLNYAALRRTRNSVFRAAIR